MAFAAVSKTIDLGATPSELGSVLHACVGDISPPVALTVAQRTELVGESGQLEPRGVVAGMVFAMLTRASFGARLKGFRSLDCWEVSCMLSGFAPKAQGDKKSPTDTRRVFEKIAWRETFELPRGVLPAQPGDESRVWGAHSFAA